MPGSRKIFRSLPKASLINPLFSERRSFSRVRRQTPKYQAIHSNPDLIDSSLCRGSQLSGPWMWTEGLIRLLTKKLTP
jgi:hypothetical protein